jgi:hypothetical protein
MTQEAEIRRLQFKASGENCPREPILENPSQKRAGGVAQDESPEFKPQYLKKKKSVKS